MPNMDTLQDDFSTGTDPDSSRWPNVPNTAATSISGGVLSITDTTGGYPIVQSAASYTIAGSYLFAKVVPPTPSGSNSQQAYISVDRDDNNLVAIFFDNNLLYRMIRTSGTDVNTSFATYNASTMQYWRIRHDGTNWYTSYSSDGSSWTEQAGFTTSWSVTTTMRATLMVGKWDSGDTSPVATYDKVNILSSTPKAGSDTATGTDSSGTVKHAQTDTGTGTENVSSRTLGNADTATGTDNAGTVVQRYTGTETGTGTESAGSVQQFNTFNGSEQASGVDSAGSLAAAYGNADTGAATDAESLAKTVSEAETGTGTDNAGTVVQRYTGTDTGLGTESESVKELKTGSGETGTATETHTNRTFTGQLDNPTTVESQSVEVQGAVAKAGSETVSSAEGQTRLQPGSFSQIPSPKVWTNGDDLYHGTLNKEWRDTFNWLLRRTSPAFEGYNDAAPTLTSLVAIAITDENLKRGSVTHTANDTKVYVWEDGTYFVYVNMGLNTTSVTADSGFASVLKVNGLVETTGDTTRSTAAHVGIQHLSSVYLNAGDYLEIAVLGSWTGTLTAVNGSETTQPAPMLSLWWRSN